MIFDEEEGSPPHPLHLDGRQIGIWRALRSKADLKFRFHDWYTGALAALASSEDVNPDRLAHAANSLREILEKIPRVLETEVSGPDRNILEQARTAMTSAIGQAKSDYPDGWCGNITEKLADGLRRVEQYVDLRSSPTRAERTFAGLAKLDPMIEALPGQSQQRKLRRYKEISKKLELFTHHQCTPDDEKFRDCLTQTEELILDLLAPLTADDQNELLAIISKGAAVTDQEIQRALQLIERRGANFAFFFENVSDPIWLEALDRAGCLSDPPSMIKTDEGLNFPPWWPMLFLKRVATKTPERIADILLKVSDTDNPRVLASIVEIATDLPLELAIRLEPVITKYINQPYHV